MALCRSCGEPVAGRRWKCDDCKSMTRGPRQPTEGEQRDRLVLSLRAAGKTFDVIAEEVGYANRGGALKAYRRAMAATGRAQLSTDERRQLALHRLDVAIAGLWARVEQGDLPALDRLDKLTKLSIRLEGTGTAPGATGGRDRDDDRPGAGGTVIEQNRLEQMRERRAQDAAKRASGPGR